MAKFESVQAMRSFASATVAVSHLLNIGFAFGGTALLSWMTAFHVPADVAVSCFFVISGFIMANIAGKSGSAFDFAARRAIRIYPMFWLAVVVTLMLPAIPGTTRTLSVVEALLLTSAAPHPITWALSFEIHFYAMVTAIIFFFRRAVPLGFAVVGAIHLSLIFLTAVGILPQGPAILVPAASCFWLGAVVCFALQRDRPWLPILLLPALVAAVALVTPFGPDMRGNNMLLYAAAFAPVLAIVLLAERGGRLRIPKPLVWWSDRSYALYLWHVPVMTVAIYWTRSALEINSTPGLLTYALASIVGIIGVTMVAYSLLERPTTQMLHRLLLKPAPVAAVT